MENRPVLLAFWLDPVLLDFVLLTWSYDGSVLISLRMYITLCCSCSDSKPTLYSRSLIYRSSYLGERCFLSPSRELYIRSFRSPRAPSRENLEVARAATIVVESQDCDEAGYVFRRMKCGFHATQYFRLRKFPLQNGPSERPYLH